MISTVDRANLAGYHNWLSIVHSYPPTSSKGPSHNDSQYIFETYVQDDNSDSSRNVKLQVLYF